MTDVTRELATVCQIEVFPLESKDVGMEPKTCLCCERIRPASGMDADGCGICEECLSP